jgi:hypothetical protein
MPTRPEEIHWESMVVTTVVGFVAHVAFISDVVQKANINSSR